MTTDLAALAALVRAHLIDDAFAIDAAALASPSVTAILTGFFPGGQLGLAGASIAEDKTRITVSGVLAQDFLGQRGLTAAAIFTVAAGEPALVLALSGFAAGWRFSACFPDLAWTLLDELPLSAPRFTLDSQARDRLPADFPRELGEPADPAQPTDQVVTGLCFEGQIARADLVGVLPWMIGPDDAALTLAGPIELRDGAPIAWLRSPQRGAVTVAGRTLALAFEVAVLRASPPPGGWLPPRCFGRAVSTLDFSAGTVAAPIAIAARFREPSPLVVRLTGSLAAPGLALADVSTLLGGAALDEVLAGVDLPRTSALALREVALEIVVPQRRLASIEVRVHVDGSWSRDLIACSDLELGFLATDPASTTRALVAELGATLTFAGVSFDACVVLPELAFNAQLPDGQPASLAGLARAMQVPAGALPPLVLAALDLRGNPATQVYELYAELEGRWPIDVGGKGVVLRELSLRLERAPAGSGGAVFAALDVAGLALSVSADVEAGAGLVLAGATSPHEVVHLADLAADVAAMCGLAAPADLPAIDVTGLAVRVDTGARAARFTAATGIQRGLTLGNVVHPATLRVWLAIDPTAAPIYAGGFEAGITFAGAAFTVELGFGADAGIAGSWVAADGGALVLDYIGGEGGLGLSGPNMPTEVEPTIVAAAFELRAGTFTLAAFTTHGGAFFAAHQEAGGGWAFVLGADLAPAARLSELPLVGRAFTALDFVVLQRAAVIVSTGTFAGYQLPALPAVGGTTPAPLGAGTTIDVQQGWAVFAQIDLASSSGAAALGYLRSLVPTATLLAQVASEGGIELVARLDGSVRLPDGAGHALVLSGATAAIRAVGDVVTYQLAGAIAFTLGGDPVQARASITIGDTGAEVAAYVTGALPALTAPGGLPGITFQDVGLAMGVTFEPPGLELGFQGQMVIGPPTEPESPWGKFAFVFQLVEGGAVNPLLFSFRISNVRLAYVVAQFTSVAVSGPLEMALQRISLSLIEFHWADAVVTLPDGTVVQPGFACAADVDIAGFAAHADLAIGVATGLQGSIALPPIELGNGAVSLTGRGKGFTQLEEEHDGAWIPVDNQRIGRTIPPPPTRTVVTIAPGGLVVALDCLRAPFLEASAELALFHTIAASLEITLDDRGFTFSLGFKVAQIGDLQLDARVTSGAAPTFHAAGRFSLQVAFSLGPIVIDGVGMGRLAFSAAVAASLTLDADPERFQLVLDLSYTAGGASHALAPVTVTVALASLDDLPARVIDAIAAQGEQVFHDLVGDATTFARDIASGIITGVDDLVAALRAGFDVVDADVAVPLLRAAGLTVDAIVAALKDGYGLAAGAAAAALGAAGYALSDFAMAIATTYQLAEAAAAAAIAGGLGDLMATVLYQGFGYGAAQAMQAIVGAGRAADRAAMEVRQVFELGAADLARAIAQGLGYDASGAMSVLRDLGYQAYDLLDALRGAFELQPGPSAQILVELGYPAEQLGYGLQQLYGDLAIVCDALCFANCAAYDVAMFLRDVGQVIAQAISLLTNAGYDAQLVQDVVNEVFGGD